MYLYIWGSPVAAGRKEGGGGRGPTTNVEINFEQGGEMLKELLLVPKKKNIQTLVLGCNKTIVLGCWVYPAETPAHSSSKPWGMDVPHDSCFPGTKQGVGPTHVPHPSPYTHTPHPTPYTKRQWGGGGNKNFKNNCE